ncbi:MAG: DUF1450 domain-containing protein [Clostridium sp.]
MKVSFCNYNEAIEKLYDKLKLEHPELQLTKNKCIGACDKCGSESIIRVDGVLLNELDSDELYKKILTMCNN